MRIETIAIGDELLTGQISDTNSTHVARELRKAGLLLSQTSVILDRGPAIQESLGEVSHRADFVICFGGLGPTSDDLTALAVAEFLKTTLTECPASKERLVRYLQERGRQVTPEALKQVLYPQKAEPIANPAGLATGFTFVHGRARFFFLPGVPREMKPMFEQSVLPVLQQQARKSPGYHPLVSHTFRLYGVPESELQRLMNPVEQALPQGAYLGYRTNPPENYLTLYSPGGLPEWEKDIRRRVLPYLFAEGDATIEQSVIEGLKQSKRTLALVESCTGGLATYRLTTVAGASQVIWGGMVTYQVAAKQQVLGVKAKTSEEAVSAQCSLELAVNLKKKAGVDIAGAITGYMGPTGGTQTDPVGTLYICVVGTKTLERRIVLPPAEREASQWMAASHLLHAVLARDGE